MNLFVIIPVYNAEGTIEGVLSRISEEDLKGISRFVVVNDGSTDKTGDAVKKLQKVGKYSITLLSHPRNRGYGAAQKTGYKHALENKAEAVLLLHADGQYPPEMIGDIIRPIIEGSADIVCGSRVLGEALKQGMPVHKLIGNILLTGILNIVLRERLTSYHCGYRAYRREALERLRFWDFSDYFDFDTEVLIGAKVARMKVTEISVPVRYGSEVSHLNPVIYGFRILRIVLRYMMKRYRLQRPF